MSESRKGRGKTEKKKGRTAAGKAEQKKKQKPKKQKEMKEPKRSTIDSRVKDYILAVVLIAVGIFLAVAFQTEAAGELGKGLSGFFKGCFGSAAYILPYYFIIYGVLLIAKKTVAASVKSVVLMIIIFLTITLLNSARFIDPYNVELSFSDIGAHYAKGMALEDGGAFGMTVGTLVVKLIGIPGLCILSAVAIIVCLLLVMNTPVSRFLENVKARKEKHEAEREARLRKKEMQKKSSLQQMEMELRNREDMPELNSEEIPPMTSSQKKIMGYMSDESGGPENRTLDDVYGETPDAFEEPYEPAMEAIDRLKSTPVIIGGFSPKEEEKKITKSEAEKQVLSEEEFNLARAAEEYVFPPIDLLKMPEAGAADNMMSRDELMDRAVKLENTLRSFNIDAEVTNVTQGPTVTRYEVHPNIGVKVSGITNLANDIALNMEAKSIRIEAPIPGKPAVGIEIENEKNNMVTIRELIDSSSFKKAKSKISFAVGKDIEGNSIVADLKSMPHLLIAGSTGSGKSVCVNSIITSILYKASPDEVKLVLIDPKVVELANYNGIPHLLIPVVTEPPKAAAALNWAVAEMDDRYRRFAEEGVREMASYNRTVKARDEEDRIMPQIVIIIDELADLMMVAKSSVEESICRLAQKARAAGMHIIVATQRPSTDVVTGLIKANIPSRIAFAVSSHHDSMTILDMSGAEKLVGKGDMLFAPLGSGKPLRVQGTFISDEEVNSVIDFVKAQAETMEYAGSVLDSIEKANTSMNGPEEKDQEDEFLKDAIELVVEMEQASVSMLQRRFRIGYNRAARIIDMMEERRIVGPADGSRPRQVLLSKEELQSMKEETEDIEQ